MLRATAPTPYTGSYSDDDLSWWADRLREWQYLGRGVNADFDNDGSGHTVLSARTLRSLLGWTASSARKARRADPMSRRASRRGQQNRDSEYPETPGPLDDIARAPTVIPTGPRPYCESPPMSDAPGLSGAATLLCFVT